MGDRLEGAAKSKSGSVLVVDDDASNRLFADTILRAAGYTVFLASNPEQCLNRLLVVEPSIILLDVNLGTMSGYDLCIRIKESFPKLRSVILFMTVNRTIEDVMFSKQVGGDYYMVKPYTAEELLANIGKAIQARQRRR